MKQNNSDDNNTCHHGDNNNGLYYFDSVYCQLLLMSQCFAGRCDVT